MKKNRRRKVERAERVKPPPEAAQHARPWPLQELLRLGPEGDGIDADEFEAAIEIVETFKMLTAELQVHGVRAADLHGIASSRQLSDRAAFMISIWFQWSMQVGPIAGQLVDQIEDALPIRSPAILRAGLRRWLKVRHDMQRGLDREPRKMLTMRSEPQVRGDRGYALPISHPSSPVRQVARAARSAGTPAQAAHRSAAAKR